MAPIRSVVSVALTVWLLLAGGCSSSSGPAEPRRTVLKDYYGEHRIVGVAPNSSARRHLPGETLVVLGEREGDTWSIARRALQNALFSNHVFEGGELVKVSRAESYAPDPLD
jgi:hypothetical protein